MSSRDIQGQKKIDFESFIMSLGANALVALGMGEIPGENIPKDPALAREFIDILILLKEKTAGNLTTAEAGTLDDLIAQLQLQYVTATNA